MHGTYTGRGQKVPGESDGECRSAHLALMRLLQVLEGRLRPGWVPRKGMLLRGLLLQHLSRSSLENGSGSSLRDTTYTVHADQIEVLQASTVSVKARGEGQLGVQRLGSVQR